MLYGLRPSADREEQSAFAAERAHPAKLCQPPFHPPVVGRCLEQFRWFEAAVGLDDRTGQGGSVRVRVLVDGIEKGGNDTELTAATGPRAVRVDVAGAKELTLVVEFGSGGDVCDHVDWADARLVK